jgi:hypothetical protein
MLTSVLLVKIPHYNYKQIPLQSNIVMTKSNAEYLSFLGSIELKAMSKFVVVMWNFDEQYGCQHVFIATVSVVQSVSKTF